MAIITVPFKEVGEGLEEGNDERGGFAHKPYLVDWGNRILFSQQVMGQSAQSGGSKGVWTRQVPYSYPESPGLYAQSTQIKPFGEWFDTTPISYPSAIVTVTFRPLDWQAVPMDDPFYLNQIDPTTPVLYATQELDYGVEYVQLPSVGMPGVTIPPKFLSDSSVVPTPLNRRVTVVRMVYTWNQLPYIPMSQIQTFLDTLNDATFLGCPKGTVLFEGPKTIREQMSDGTVVQKLTYNFKYRSVDWNMSLRPDTGLWDVVYFGGSSANKTFAYQSFTPLLLQGSS